MDKLIDFIYKKNNPHLRNYVSHAGDKTKDIDMRLKISDLYDKCIIDGKE